jgi:hypothetical protein
VPDGGIPSVVIDKSRQGRSLRTGFRGKPRPAIPSRGRIDQDPEKGGNRGLLGEVETSMGRAGQRRMSILKGISMAIYSEERTTRREFFSATSLVNHSAQTQLRHSILERIGMIINTKERINNLGLLCLGFLSAASLLDHLSQTQSPSLNLSSNFKVNPCHTSHLPHQIHKLPFDPSG